MAAKKRSSEQKSSELDYGLTQRRFQVQMDESEIIKRLVDTLILNLGWVLKNIKFNSCDF